MALFTSLIRFLINKKKAFNYHGHLLTLGKQDVMLKPANFNIFFETSSANGMNEITEEMLFKQLGFEEVSSLDYYGTPGASIEHDLNIPVNTRFHNNFDFIIDGGTLEHCFNVSIYMESIVRVLRQYGTVIHINPTQGYANHGFFNFQPTFYFSFYQANGFEDTECYFLEFLDNNYYEDDSKVRVFKVENFNNLDYKTDKRTMIIFKAVKKKEKEKIILPVQEFYYRIHKEKEKRKCSILPDDLYQEIVGDIKDNNYELMLRKSNIL